MAHHIVVFLITLAVGYWLLTLAEKQGGLNKTLGQVFAWIIIVVSLLGPVCVVANAFCRHSYGGGWHHRGMGWQGRMDGCCGTDGQGGMKGDACPMMGGKGAMMKGHDGMGMMMGKDKDKSDKAEGEDDKGGSK